ncbi:hypothetical protein GCM10010885_04760 [Alicyclobacillus cellulosilyticus]|uniref:YolD-like protein n=1 Tax=Alicyclobacillus cellulosilyticus TaxID=1003997 RepID=A0A917NFY9_9BACL|nr:YolD-like family protein [Alicyclobacillus cellulosilyticus]GGI98244.1 hypothetical protein GCM10010885_04760 [Alicyclobacillus cellulosilyticus]
MTSIRDGNIFAAMRLLLPEHRATAETYRQQRERRQPPELSEDALTEMQFILQKAAARRKPVRLTLFDQAQDEMLLGIPEIRDGRIWIHTEDGRRLPLDGRRVLRVEPG